MATRSFAFWSTRRLLPHLRRAVPRRAQRQSVQERARHPRRLSGHVERQATSRSSSPSRGAIFILPYFLFSATAGAARRQIREAAARPHRQALGDRRDAGRGRRASRFDSIAFQLAVLFVLGVQAAFFGPVKYGILPSSWRATNCSPATPLIEAGTFLAILIGTIAGGLLILAPHGPAIVVGGAADHGGRAAGSPASSSRAPRRARPSCASTRTSCARPGQILRYAYRQRRAAPAAPRHILVLVRRHRLSRRNSRTTRRRCSAPTTRW